MSGILKIMIGFPRSGKTTLVELLAMSNDSLVVEPDWIRTNILGHQFHRPAEPIIWLIADSFIRIALSQGHNVILDGTNLPDFVRAKYIALAKEMDARVEGAWITTPMSVCIERNNSSSEGQKLPHEALIAKEEQLVEPSMEEGFDALCIYDQHFTVVALHDEKYSWSDPVAYG